MKKLNVNHIALVVLALWMTAVSAVAGEIPIQWKKGGKELDDNTKYIVAFTYLKIKDAADTQKLLKYAEAVEEEVRNNPGGMQHALYAPRVKGNRQFYTVTIWKDAESLKNFKSSPNHKKAMTDLKDLVEDTGFEKVDRRKSELPDSWDEFIDQQKED